MLFVHHFPSCRGWSAAQNSSGMKTLLAGLNLRQANLPRSVIFPRRASPPLSQHDQAGGSHFLVATQPFGIPNSSLAVPIISDGAGGRPLRRLPPSRFPRGGGFVFTPGGQVFVCTTAPLPYLFQLPHKPPPLLSLLPLPPLPFHLFIRLFVVFRPTMLHFCSVCVTHPWSGSEGLSAC